MRQLIIDGNVSAASSHLSRPHSVCGVVVSGDQRGRELGFPTANILSSTELIPAMGVYAAHIRINQGPPRDAIVNLGTRPTFDGVNFTIEVHIFDFDEDIYGHQVRILFHERIRAEKRFEKVDDFKAQLQHDIEKAKAILLLASCN